MAAGLSPWWWEINETRFTIKGQAKRFINNVQNSCIHFKYEESISILYITLINSFKVFL